MNISEIIEILHKIKDEHGDIEVLTTFDGHHESIEDLIVIQSPFFGCDDEKVVQII